jgi:hypothetical protein
MDIGLATTAEWSAAANFPRMIGGTTLDAGDVVLRHGSSFRHDSFPFAASVLPFSAGQMSGSVFVGIQV